MGAAIVSEQGSDWILHYKKLAVCCGGCEHPQGITGKFPEEMKKVQIDNIVEKRRKGSSGISTNQ